MIVELLNKYFRLKDEAKALRKKRQTIAEKHGECIAIEDHETPCYYSTRLSEKDYCDVCKVKNPLTEELRRNARSRGAIMYRLKSLSKQERGDEDIS